MTRTCFIAINGIRTNPGDAEGWTDRMTSAINLRTPDGVKAEKFEYFCTAAFRWVKQRKRADELLQKVNEYANQGWRVVLVGHSNGCDLISRVLGLGVKVDAVHLFAPATDEDGFAIAIGQRLVRRIHIYGSPDDEALKGAARTHWLLALFGLAYGSMGLRGLEFAKAYPANVKDHSIAGYGHSTWFQRGEHFEHTMDLLLLNEAEDCAGLKD